MRCFNVRKITNCSDPQNFQSTEEEYSQANVLDGKYGILVELESKSIINHIQMKLDDESWIGYDIEVSLNASDGWKKVIEYSQYACMGEQSLYFRETEVNFIRILSPEMFDCNSFKVTFVAEIPHRLKDGVVCPQSNTDMKADVWFDLGFEEHMKYQTLWQKFQEKATDTPYIAAKQGKIIGIHFNQPYYLDTIRIRLWDFDGRKQSFKVKTFIPRHGLETISDRKEPRQGWQTVKFEGKPIDRIHVEATGDDLRIAFMEAFLSFDTWENRPCPAFVPKEASKNDEFNNRGWDITKLMHHSKGLIHYSHLSG